jgi:hypothetical protein
MLTELENKEEQIFNLEREIKRLKTEKLSGGAKSDTYENVMREETNIMETVMQKYINEEEKNCLGKIKD